MKNVFKYIFGPVASRRLGISLGIDLMPSKTCSLDCIYCECGKTTRLTDEPKCYTPVEAILNELNQFLCTEPQLDFITFSGSGEPTLHKGIGAIIRFLKNNYPQYKIAILTNGTLFNHEKVTDRVLEADLLVVSVDAGKPDTFCQINRPHPRLNFNDMINGIMMLREKYTHEFWVEIFLVPKVNDNLSDLKAVKNIITELNPDKIQLNTLDRPGTETWIKPVDKKRLNEVTSFLHSSEIIPKFCKSNLRLNGNSDIDNLVLSTLKRRPCTQDDIALQFGISIEKAQKCLDTLAKEKKVKRVKLERGIFYHLR